MTTRNVTCGVVPVCYLTPTYQYLTELVSFFSRSEEHTSELQSRLHLVCRLLLEKKKIRVRSTRCQRCGWAPPGPPPRPADGGPDRGSRAWRRRRPRRRTPGVHVFRRRHSVVPWP